MRVQRTKSEKEPEAAPASRGRHRSVASSPAEPIPPCLGGEYNRERLVFPDLVKGLRWAPDQFSSAFYYQAHKVKIPVSVHGLRHSFATIAERAGASLKDTSEFLGHSAISITADIYSHVFDDSRRQVAERVGEALSQA